MQKKGFAASGGWGKNSMERRKKKVLFVNIKKAYVFGNAE
jgi:hypothetical protein